MADGESSSASALQYKYVSIAGLRRILDGYIRFTQPSAFNDPFELLPEIVIPLNAEDRKIKLQFDIGSARAQAPQETLQVIPEGCGSSDAISREIVQKLNAHIGILSLSHGMDEGRAAELTLAGYPIALIDETKHFKMLGTTGHR
jgi:hypothetical protein